MTEKEFNALSVKQREAIQKQLFDFHNKLMRDIAMFLNESDVPPEMLLMSTAVALSVRGNQYESLERGGIPKKEALKVVTLPFEM